MSPWHPRPSSRSGFGKWVTRFAGRPAGDPLLGEGFPSPEDEAGRDFRRGIDIADHLGEIEAPILFNLAASETYSQVGALALPGWHAI